MSVHRKYMKSRIVLLLWLLWSSSLSQRLRPVSPNSAWINKVLLCFWFFFFNPRQHCYSQIFSSLLFAKLFRHREITVARPKQITERQFIYTKLYSCIASETTKTVATWMAGTWIVNDWNDLQWGINSAWTASIVHFRYKVCV